LAAATLAAAVAWPLEVFVPPSADPAVLARLEELGATVTLCPRTPGGPPGDPCVHRFHAAVDGGAIPFVVQGPENALCLDLGRALAWEMAGHGIGQVLVQVGGGALATAVADGFADRGERPQLLAVQTAGCAPLARAWVEHGKVGGAPGATWAACMRPWETEPRSLAYGILDDETYDWVGVAEGVSASSGAMVVADEADIEGAYALGRAATEIDVDHTGTAGLAGVLHLAGGTGWSDPAARVAVLFTGRRRSG
jgi:threonine synthase